MPRAKGKKATLGNSLQTTKTYKPKKDGAEHYKQLDRSEKNDKFSSFQDNKVSITEQSSLQAFLDHANLQNRDFVTERTKMRELVVLNENDNSDSEDDLNDEMNFVKIDEDGNKIVESVLTEAELKEIRETRLTLPRKPRWTRDMTKEELVEKENISFLEWRRTIAEMEESSKQAGKFIGNVTPYEKNLEFWRQLWRVVEYSDVVVQILDCRNPLLFYSADLIKYVQEMAERQETKKYNLLLLNKADLLSEYQREQWHQYFSKIEGVDKVVFFSAKIENDELHFENLEENGYHHGIIQDNEVKRLRPGAMKSDHNVLKADHFDSVIQKTPKKKNKNKMKFLADEEEEAISQEYDDESDVEEAEDDDEASSDQNDDDDDDSSHEQPITTQAMITQIRSSSKLLKNVEGLLQVLKGVRSETDESTERLKIGLVGYPNVGKSSTINAIKGRKCVSVSATPGKTKHYQTIELPDDDITLYDCPGLVLPNTANTKAELVINGILPIDQLRDWRAPVNAVCKLVYKSIFERRYGIDLSHMTEYEQAHKISTGKYVPGRKLLVYMARAKGFAVKGRPDESRAARIILKEFVNGQLLYCQCPPELSGEEVEKFRHSTLLGEKEVNSKKKEINNNSVDAFVSKDTPNFDAKFFQKQEVKCLTKGKGVNLFQRESAGLGQLPDKKFNRTKNKNKKEKARRKRAKDDDADYY